MALTNKDDHKDSYKEILEKLAKERFHEKKEVIDEIKHNDLLYYFKGNTTRFEYFNNGIERFTKTQSVEMKLEEVKNCKMLYLNQF